MMWSKGVLASKINWTAILLFLAGLAEFKDRIPEPYVKWIMLISGIALLAMRTFFTDKVIDPKRVR